MRHMLSTVSAPLLEDPAVPSGYGPAAIGEDTNAVLQDAVFASAAAASAANQPFAPDRFVSVNPDERIVAYFDMGGTPSSDPSHRKLAYALYATGWEVVLRNHFQPYVDAGVTRLSVHTPFGQRSYVIDPETGALVPAPGQWAYQFDAYFDAMEEVPDQNATRDFVSAWQDFLSSNAAAGHPLDVIMYIGSPRHDPDQVALVDDPEAWWSRAYDILEPLLQAGVRSIGFDGSAPATPEMLDSQLYDVLARPELRDPVRDARLIELVGDEPITVFLEAVPTRDSGRTDLPLLLLDWDYMRQDPTIEGQEKFLEHDRFTGEIIRIVRREQWLSNKALAAETILQDGHTAAISPGLFLKPANGGASTLDGFISMMNLPSLPTLVDLDPKDVNPETATFRITRGPKYGTLAPNRWYDDVFTYVPDPGFVGQDSLVYQVRDGSGKTATGKITFFVNVPVDTP